MKVHELDCISDVFQDIYNGVRSFDIRDEDRDYEIGDSLHLKEYNIKLNRILAGGFQKELHIFKIFQCLMVLMI